MSNIPGRVAAIRVEPDTGRKFVALAPNDYHWAEDGSGGLAIGDLVIIEGYGPGRIAYRYFVRQLT